ncbi:MAG: nuclear transport factor 2 family protein [Comamonadaceae bacterium]|nr:MAG: nuclear transport factor 2 family protein [Comamonadaceae bacterium]
MMAADIKTALNDLIGGSDPLEDVIARHFAPNYRQRTNGIWDDFAGFKEHIAYLRDAVRRIDVTVLDEVTDNEQYSSRHVVDIVKTDGSLVKQEVYLFGEQNVDGKFTRVEEVTMMLEGTESDRGLGNAR